METMNWQHRTLIIPIALAEPARAACMACAGNGAESMFTWKLSATEEEPATHACHIIDDGGHPYETFAELGLSLIEE